MIKKNKEEEQNLVLILGFMYKLLNHHTLSTDKPTMHKSKIFINLVLKTSI